MTTTLPLERRERIRVRIDGEELDVYNWATVQQWHRVRGHNPVRDQLDYEISAGDSKTIDPDAVTHWVAEELRDLGIDLEDDEIEVVDVTADDVEVL